VGLRQREDRVRFWGRDGVLLVQAVAHLAAIADVVEDAVAELQTRVVCCFDAGNASAVLSQPSRVVDYERVTLGTVSSLFFEHM
jgi:hypothetical protein